MMDMQLSHSGAEEDLLENMSVMSKDSDMEKDSQGWQISSNKKTRKKKPRQVVVATRANKRMSRDGMPIAEKATSRAIAKTNISGISSSSNPFTVLNDTPTEFLHAVINDLNIEGENVDEQLDVFRAEEIARAALAEANYKVFFGKTEREIQTTE